MDRLESMSILLQVVEAGSLSAASRRLGAPLTTVSRKIGDLESHLKTRLLNRTSRRLTLTEAGQSYVAACRRILEQIDEAERTVAGEYSLPKGELVVTAPVVFGRLHVLPVAVAFLQAFPDIDLRLSLADSVINMLEENIDVAVRIGVLPDSSLIATRIGTLRRVVCGSPAYFAARGVPRSPDELGAHHCVTFEGLMSPVCWNFVHGKNERMVRIHSRLVVNTAEAAVDAALAGVGVTRVLSYQAAPALRAGTLAIVLEEFEPAPWPVSLVYSGSRSLALKLRAFLDFAAPRLKIRLREAAPPG
jgi:DNA-binding transcriptional LysR family regulator